MSPLRVLWLSFWCLWGVLWVSFRCLLGVFLLGCPLGVFWVTVGGKFRSEHCRGSSLSSTVALFKPKRVRWFGRATSCQMEIAGQQRGRGNCETERSQQKRAAACEPGRPGHFFGQQPSGRQRGWQWRGTPSGAASIACAQIARRLAPPPSWLRGRASDKLASPSTHSWR
jgi:hypothetical protein